MGVTHDIDAATGCVGSPTHALVAELPADVVKQASAHSVGDAEGSLDSVSVAERKDPPSRFLQASHVGLNESGLSESMASAGIFVPIECVALMTMLGP